jgi:prepilin-type processing-associated H-X9-DG protein
LITDGLSTTLFVGERSSRLGGSTWLGSVSGGEDNFVRILGVADHPPTHPTGHFDDFGSYHPTGANFLLGDGSVRLISQDIDQRVYQGMASKSGGEFIPAGY